MRQFGHFKTSEMRKSIVQQFGSSSGESIEGGKSKCFMSQEEQDLLKMWQADR
jgi:hypothetical protein